jgi:hypothetical protein
MIQPSSNMSESSVNYPDISYTDICINTKEHCTVDRCQGCFDQCGSMGTFDSHHDWFDSWHSHANLWMVKKIMWPELTTNTDLPTVIKSFKFNVIHWGIFEWHLPLVDHQCFNAKQFIVNTLTTPPYILGCIFSVLVIWHSDKVRERGLHGAFSGLYAACTLSTFLLLNNVIL